MKWLERETITVTTLFELSVTLLFFLFFFSFFYDTLLSLINKY